MKKVLVTVPMVQEDCPKLERIVSDLKEEYRFFYVPMPGRVLPDEMIRKGILRSEVEESDRYDFDIILGDADPAETAKMKKLQMVQISSAGYEGFIVPGALPVGCVLANAKGVYDVIVSEHAIALTFDCCKNIPFFQRNRTERLFQKERAIKIIAESVVVILGMGSIGSTYARYMKALGAYIIGIKRTPGEKPAYVDELLTADKLDEVLPRADILTIVAPGGKETYHMLNEERLSVMKDDSLIVNVGRGSVIDETALVKLLKEGKFFGVGTDVFEVEPLPKEHPFWEIDRVLITPHSAGSWGAETVEKENELMRESLYAWTHGKELRNRVATIE